MMNLSLQHQIGAIAGWKLEIRRVTPGAIATPGPPVPSEPDYSFSSADYRGSVDAMMVSGLEAGSYTVVVEDVSEQDVKKLTASAKDPLQARLFLYWVDAPRPTVGTEGLVAVLRVTTLRRRPGKWRYEMVVEGREWVYDRLALRCPPDVTGNGPLDAAVNLALAMKIELDTALAFVAMGKPSKPNPNLRGIDELRGYEKAMVAEAAMVKEPRAGLGGMYLIRDGKLRLGPDRLELPPTPPTLDASSGLLAIERTGAVREDDRQVGIDELPVGTDKGKSNHRDRFAVTLRGRPDLKPGDVVQFEPPEQGGFGEELGFALGPAAQVIDGTHITVYIEEVRHRLNREQGFLTVIRCVAAASGQGDLVERLWFDGVATDSVGGGGSSETFLTREFDRMRDAGRIDRWPDVAQVRAQHLPGGNVPPLTEKLWRGLVAPDGRPYAAARLEFGKNRKDLEAAPYATPFAYGHWGLALPRYPGTRVLVVNRGGEPDDPVDIGALWSRGDGPPAEMGDWWLCLPVDVDGDKPPRASVADKDAADPPQSGTASHDLIDAHGNRVIEVGKLTIRIGKDRLQAPTQRPVAEADPVSIEHDSGSASITIAQNGAITIRSAKTLTLKGADGITLESDAGVTIKVGTQVDVQKKP